jgi:4-hydroxythreonine-4-phosphate dehydrogenase
MTKKNRLGITMGDPAGVGPEIIIKALEQIELSNTEIVLYGSKIVFEKAQEKFAVTLKKLPEIVETTKIKNDFPIGIIDKECGMAAYDTIVQATKDTINKKIDAIITAPVNKASINLSSTSHFTGHTELIAELCKTKKYAMMQSAGDLRVVFATTHIPLKDVSENVTKERIIEVTNLINDVIKREGITSPKIAIAGLNPHAGEDGYMGKEDEEVVKPAIAELISAGLNISGPFPSDTLFIQEIREQFDGIVSMYHDQGHIPFKMLAFDKGVNSTLGLPIIRTSVDHGTAFNIAWQGKASPNSLIEAIKIADV